MSSPSLASQGSWSCLPIGICHIAIYTHLGLHPAPSLDSELPRAVLVSLEADRVGGPCEMLRAPFHGDVVGMQQGTGARGLGARESIPHPPAPRSSGLPGSSPLLRPELLQDGNPGAREGERTKSLTWSSFMGEDQRVC